MFQSLGTSASIVGESPVWHDLEQVLYYVDVRGCRVLRYDPEIGSEIAITTPELVGCIAPRAAGGVYAAMQTGLFVVNDGCNRIHAMPEVPTTHRFNDGTWDSAGRFLAGTMRLADQGRANDGEVYVFAPSTAPRKLMEGFWTVNGLAFSPDCSWLYVSDSATEVQTIWRCPYDIATGEVGPREVFVDMSCHEGRPDGGATDSAGGYWTAATEAGAVLRFDAGGAMTNRLDVGTPRISKPCFGGRNLDQIFVTSLRLGQEHDPVAGRLFGGPAPFQGWCPPPLSGLIGDQT